jgi:translation initiation factor 1
VKPSGGLVYSTESGRMCPGCRQPVAACSCKTARLAPAGDGIAKVARQTKGRGGKCVTTVSGLALEPAALAALGKLLRSTCGSGGTLKDGVIEVQGDHGELILQTLIAQGYRAKRSGG